MAQAAIMAGLAAAPAIIKGGQEAYDIGMKYAPKVKQLANHIFTKKNQRSASAYLKNLGTVKGLKKLALKDIPKAASAASKYISSGKGLKAFTDITQDVQKIGNIASSVGAHELGRDISKAGQNVQVAGEKYHDILSGYNDKGKELVHQFKTRETGLAPHQS